MFATGFLSNCNFPNCDAMDKFADMGQGLIVGFEEYIQMQARDCEEFIDYGLAGSDFAIVISTGPFRQPLGAARTRRLRDQRSPKEQISFSPVWYKVMRNDVASSPF